MFLIPTEYSSYIYSYTLHREGEVFIQHLILTQKNSSEF